MFEPFRALLDHWGHKGPAEIPPKRVFVFKDCYRYSRLHGIPFTMPAAHPFNSLQALRLSLPEVSGKLQQEVIALLWNLAWVQGKDLASEPVLREALQTAGFDAAALLEKTKAPEVKQQLREETEAAIARGVFGIPTMWLEGELFWGVDQFDYIALRLQGKDPLDPEAVKMLQVPRGIDRKSS